MTACVPRPLSRFRRSRLFAGAVALGWTLPAAALSLAEVLDATVSGNREVQASSALVRGAEGVALAARGAFDPQLSLSGQRSRDERPLSAAERAAVPSLENQVSSGAGVAARIEQRLASGLTLSGSAVSTHADDRYARESGQPARTSRSLLLGLKLPLARGAGPGNAASATLAAAEEDREAARRDSRHQLSLALRDAAVAYWEYASRWRQLEISRLGEARTLELLQELKKLIAADEVPAADLDLALANHAERGNARIAAEQALLEARQALARSMGLAADAQGLLGRPGDDFPPIQRESAPPLDSLRQRALARRQDWQALEARIAALRQRLTAARDLARPVVDLAINVGANGLREGATIGASANPVASPFAGPGLMAQLQVQLPVGNHGARGAIEQASAQLTEAEIRQRALHDDIGAAVEARLAELRHAAEALAGSAQIVRLYGRSLDHERTRRRLGMATLIDVINVEDRYFRALLEDVQRQRNHAVALARLGHEVDQLLAATSDAVQIDLPAFTRLSP